MGLLTCITGVSGSGKSTLINNTLFPITATALNGASTLEVAPYDSFDGLQHLDKVVDIDQSPIGAPHAPTRRPTPACSRPSANSLPGYRSPLARLRADALLHVKGGRCEACQATV